MMRTQAAPVIAMSAMLHTKKYRSMKSTTAPWKNSGGRTRRSMRFPVRPPSSSPSAQAQAVEPKRRPAHRITTNTTRAMTVNTHVAFDPIPKAAPSLRRNWRPTRSPTIGIRGRPSSAATAICFVI